MEGVDVNGLPQEAVGGGGEGRGRAIHGKFGIVRFSNGRSWNGLMHKGWCLQLWSSMIFGSFCYTKNLCRAASGENRWR